MTSAIPLAIAGRFLLSLTNANEYLKHNHLLASPLTSYSRLQEGIYLYEHGVDPYAGGGFYHSPILLSLFSTVFPLNSVRARFLWAICDAMSGYLLVQIWRARSKVEGSVREKMILGAFLLNPYLFLSSLALSTSTLENILFLFSTLSACRARISACLLSLAVLSYLSLSSILFAPPLIMLLLEKPESSLASPKNVSFSLRKFTKLLMLFMAHLVALGFMCTLATGGTSWLLRSSGTGLLLPELTPNPGLWWYFFTEMFDHFRPFFSMVFSMHLVIYVTPICMKFCHDPLYATFMLQGIIATFKPYPTLADSGLFLSSLALFPEVYPYLRHEIVTALLHLHASLLLPLFENLWLVQGTGNANFFYASTLVFGLANGAAVTDSLFAGLRIAFPTVKGHDIVQE